MVFFNLLPGAFVPYSSITAIVLAALLTAAMIAYYVYAFIRKKISVKTLFIELGVFFAFAAGASLAGLLVSVIVARLTLGGLCVFAHILAFAFAMTMPMIANVMIATPAAPKPYIDGQEV